MQLLALGIISEYLGRMYESIKARPIYIIERVYSVGEVQTGTALSMRQSGL